MGEKLRWWELLLFLQKFWGSFLCSEITTKAIYFWMCHYRAVGKDLVLTPKFLSDLSMCRSIRGVSILANSSGSQLHTAGMAVWKMKPSFFLPIKTSQIWRPWGMALASTQDYTHCSCWQQRLDYLRQKNDLKCIF